MTYTVTCKICLFVQNQEKKFVLRLAKRHLQRNPYLERPLIQIFNKPGVAGAVLQTPL